MFNKRMISCIAFALCLILCGGLFAVPAFADNTVIVIGGPIVEAPVVVSADSTAPVVVSSESVSAGSTVVTATQAPASQAVVIGADPALASTQTDTQAAVSVQQAAEQSVSTAISGLTADLFAQINAVRKQNGLSAVGYSSALQSAADTRAKESAVNFSHIRPDGSDCATAVTVDYTVTGENLIQATSELATASIMVETWMNSESHRHNLLLAAFTQMAVGIHVENGTTYVALLFVG